MSALPVLAQRQTALQPDTLLQSAAQQTEAWGIEEEDDASDFTFTESQLDEDLDAAQVIANVTSSSNDPYRSEVGFLWSAMRFRLRALDNMYATSYLNGLLFNDLEMGRFNYSLVGGMNDATRNKEGVDNSEYNTFGIAGLGGGDNTNLRASKFQQGQKITASLCNRNYKYRGVYSFGTGLMTNGWAFGGLIGYRGASEGVIEGTFYNSLSYLISAEKRIGENHALSLVTFGAPTERAQQGASTEEAYWLANSHYYNPNWGYQDGKKRNARVVNDYEPTAILTWDWHINDASNLTTNVGFKYAMYSSSALGFAGEAYDPRPDYYKNLPSSIFNVYDESINNQNYLNENIFLVDQYNALLDRWSTKAGRQIDWDRLYYINRQNTAAGGGALYYQERRHNNQRVWALSSTYNRLINARNKMSAGIQLNSTKGMHYTTMADLLGASYYTDIDKFAAGDYGLNSIQAQSDLRHPNRRIKEGDTFGYDYETEVLFGQIWAQYQYTIGSFNANLQANLDGIRMRRNGKMQNGQGQLLQADGTYFDNSYGHSDWAGFLGGGVKAQAQWRPWANQTLTLAAGWAQKAPLVRNAFVAPRIQNNFVNNLTLEDHLSADASWKFRFGNVSGKAGVYFIEMKNLVEQTAFFNDANSAFTYLTMSNVSKRHYGAELALKWNITDKLSLHATGTWNQALYTNNPYAQLNTQGMNESDNYKVNQWVNPVTGEKEKLLVAADGMHVGSTPLTALNFGAEYSIRNWFFEVNLNWYDRVYVGFSQYRRLTNIMDNYTNNAVNAEGSPVYSVTKAEIRDNGAVLWDESTGKVKKIYGAQQEKFHPGFMLDASIGRYIRLRNGKSMSINLSAQNLTNNTNLRTGGYEQNRDDNYYNSYGTGDGSRGLAKAYKFSRNSKYYYANSINAFLNVNFKW
ncbi:MAG: TonB-dependent receptor [Bacteroidales bacterium]|nr:TonB-dependent receptor [Bacteroidales bacterium]